jgi:hypothetical protein
MNMVKMLKKAGFIMTDNNFGVDWNSNYDAAIIRLILSMEAKLKKRDRKIAKLQHDIAKLKASYLRPSSPPDPSRSYDDVERVWGKDYV